MDLPQETFVASSTAAEARVSGKVGGEVGIPLITKAKAEGGLEVSGRHGSETRVTRLQANIAQVAREIAGSDYTVFVGDFHYIPNEVRPEIARQIKAEQNGAFGSAQHRCRTALTMSCAATPSWLGE